MQPRCVIEYGQQPVNALAWSPWCSTEFAAVTDAGTLEIWDLASSVVVPKCELQITDDSRPASSVSYAHDAPVIFVGCANGTMHVYACGGAIRPKASRPQRRKENLSKTC